MGLVNLSSKGLSIVRSMVTWAWVGWMEGKWINCCPVTKSTLKFWYVWGTWANGASMGGCEDIPFPFLKFSACWSKFMSSYFTFDALNFFLIMSLYLSPFFVFHLFSQLGVVDLRWGTYISTFPIGYMHVRIHACQMCNILIFRTNTSIMKREEHGKKNSFFIFLCFTEFIPRSLKFWILAEFLLYREVPSYQ